MGLEAVMAEDMTVTVKAAIVQTIIDLNLVSDDGKNDIGSRVLGQMIEDESDHKWPAVIVTQHGEREEVAEMGFEDDSYFLPFHVFIADRRSARSQAMETVYQSWRSRIRNAFMQDQQSAPLVAAGVGMVEVEFKDVIEAEYKKFSYLQSGLNVRAYVVVDRDQEI